MTLIGAKRINDKWTMLADSAATIWQIRTRADTCYRPKIRLLEWKDVSLYVASCWTIKDIDFITNVIEKCLAKAKIKDTKQLKFLLQDALEEGYSSLKTLTNDPSASFLFLEPKTDTVFIWDEYSITQVEDYSVVVMWSWDQSFYKLFDGYVPDFYKAFKQTVQADEYCDLPIVSVRDWEVKLWWWWEDEKRFNNYCYWTSDGDEILCCNGPTPAGTVDEEHISRGTNKEL